MKQILLMIAVVALVGCGTEEQAKATPDASANKLFVEAVKLISSADEQTGEAAIKDYEQGLANIQTIIDDYSESDLAVKLISGETLFTGKSLKEIKERVKELKRAAEADAFAGLAAAGLLPPPGTPVPIVEEGEFIVVNPAGSTRYLMVEILLVRKDSDDYTFPSAVKENRKQLEAQVSNVLSALSAEEMSEPSVRNSLPNYLKALFQAILGTSHPIDKVIIPKWVMQ